MCYTHSNLFYTLNLNWTLTRPINKPGYPSANQKLTYGFNSANQKIALLSPGKTRLIRPYQGYREDFKTNPT